MNKTAFSISILVILAIMATPLWAQDPTEYFRKGNQLYEKGEFDKAIEAYSKITEKDVKNGMVYFNLANSYLKTGQVAPAILYYEKALSLAPRDESIRENLSFAESLTRDKFDTSQTSIFTNLVRTIHHYLTLNEWTLLTSLIYIITAMLLLARILSSSPVVRDILFYLLVLFLLLLLITLIFFGVKVNDTIYTQRVVIMDDTINVLSGPGDTYTTLLKVHAGARAEIIQQRNNWIQIYFKNGYSGWIPKNTTKTI